VSGVPQKSSISRVSRSPLIGDPAIALRPKTNDITDGDGWAVGGMPTRHITPSRLRAFTSGSRLCDAAAGSRMKSSVPAIAATCRSSFESTTYAAPSRFASAAPFAAASWMAICPSPPSPTAVPEGTVQQE
jgi:hypothetical protein